MRTILFRALMPLWLLIFTSLVAYFIAFYGFGLSIHLAQTAAYAVAIVFLLTLGMYALLTGVPPMPSSHAQEQAVLSAIPKDKKLTVYELGSGWGTLALAVGRKRPQVSVTGFEISLLPHMVAKFSHKLGRHKNVTFRRLDFFKEDMGNADVIVCYLYESVLTKLRDKLSRELPQDSLVISSAFPIPEWTPVKTIDVHKNTKVFIYRLSDSVAT